ncbi:hypothetical protein QQP08_020904 [Theobroma cacao]|nr:hypothetical protein QQP08_020904 [Theobroma cacao]
MFEQAYSCTFYVYCPLNINLSNGLLLLPGRPKAEADKHQAGGRDVLAMKFKNPVLSWLFLQFLKSGGIEKVWGSFTMELRTYAGRQHLRQLKEDGVVSSLAMPGTQVTSSTWRLCLTVHFS